MNGENVLNAEATEATEAAEAAEAAGQDVAEVQAAAVPDAPAAEDRAAAEAERISGEWLRQAEEARTTYPDLDLARELGDGRFCALLLGGADVGTAYAAVHMDSIISEAMKYAVREAGRKMSARIAENDARAPENGARPGSVAARVIDVSRMSRAEREDIARRVARGERITL